MSDAIKAAIDAMVESIQAHEDKRAFRKNRFDPGRPFRGEDGLVHVVYAEYETLCDQLVRRSDLAIGWHEVGFLYGTYCEDNPSVTCLACLAEGVS